MAEAAQRREDCFEAIKTVYIGGGTPSTLPVSCFRRLIRGIRELFPFEPSLEWTSEVNPGTLTTAWLEEAALGGVNRISMGMQAAQPAVLATLGRIHTPEQVWQSVQQIRQAGFDNLSLDLMFGIPGQSAQDWKETVHAALAMEPQHLSAYGLIPEPGTPMNDQIEKGILTLPDPEDERLMYHEAIQVFRSGGYFQYEISNFARHGYACRHNIGYWRQLPYIGIGVAAASMLPLSALPATHRFRVSGSAEMGGFPCVRQTNPESLEAYFHMVRLSDPGEADGYRETIRIPPEEARFETMMLGLRMNEGISVSAFEKLHGVSLDCVYGKALREMESQNLVRFRNGYWMLTPLGMDVQNTVLIQLMQD